MNSLQIGSAKAMLTPKEIEYIKDNRRELVKTLTYSGGNWVPSVAILDNGICQTGLVVKYSGVQFDATNWTLVEGYADNLSPVTVTDPDGSSHSSCHIYIASYKRQKQFSGIVTEDVEVWRA